MVFKEKLTLHNCDEIKPYKINTHRTYKLGRVRRWSASAYSINRKQQYGEYTSLFVLRPAMLKAVVELV